MSFVNSVRRAGDVAIRRAPSELHRAASFVRLAILLTYAYPLLWVLGVAGAYWIVLGLASAAYLLRASIRGIAWIPLAIGATLLLSSGVGYAAFGFDIGRALSLVGNVFIWISLAALVSAARIVSYWRVLAKSLLVVLMAQGVIVAAAAITFPARIGLPLMEGLTAGLPSGFRAFSVDKLFTEDWLGGHAYRSAGLMGQPTWAGAFGALAGVIAVAVIFDRSFSRRWRAFAVLTLPAAYFGLQLSLSRAGQIALIVGIVAGLLVVLLKRLPMLFYAIVTYLLIAFVFVAVFGGERVAAYFETVNSERAGSLQTRGAIYSVTFDLIAALPVPLLGYGIKPKDDDLVASVATHSAYLGMIFRGGLLGLALLILLIVTILVIAFRAGDPFAATIAAFALVWCLLEDFDPGHFLPLVIAYACARILSRTVVPELSALSIRHPNAFVATRWGSA